MPAPPTTARVLYLHGFASGPGSAKAKAFAQFAAARGIPIERLDLRRPNFEHLRLSAMIDHVRERIGGARERVVLVGSSLGGLTACRVAERDPRVAALVLMAPAFRLMDLWASRLGPEGLAAWSATGWLEVDDYQARAKARVDYGFFEDMTRADPEEPPDVRVPVLLFHGVGDDVVPIARARDFAAGRRNVRLVEVDDGHELVRSLPDIVAESARFLAGWGWDAA
ncbi:MAG: alpha/beta fold hydrolase [Myxococcales bacterium]|jgi:pimeloyl-ACP methyl ester carboxylesterase|nr:alpha/beta fold hydrolase [Myxococcales bacterium]MBL0195229.1 alpha/beta fold hydrolase [Myxococcales bacterium]HQY64028.1 YqiA/YcfP family alpha/beta fold hydrolase [Polyangiaceae bacterium]